MATSFNDDPSALPRIMTVNPSTGRPQPSEAFHPDQIDKAFAYNVGIKQCRDAMQFAWDGVGNIDDLRATPNPEDRPAAHARKVVTAADSFERGFHLKCDAARATIDREIVRVEAELNDAAGLKANPRFEAAICAAFAAMSPVERQSKIGELIAQDEIETLATLIEAPCLATGLDPESRAGIRLRVLTKRAPEMLALKDQLVRAREKLVAASVRGIGVVSKLRSGTDRFSASVKAAHAVADRVTNAS